MGFLFGPKPDSGMGATPTSAPTVPPVSTPTVPPVSTPTTSTPTSTASVSTSATATPVTPPASTAVVHHCSLPHLTSVEFLDGEEIVDGVAQPKKMIADSIQYVNLPREDKFVDGTVVKNIDRLGRKLRVKVEFSQRGTHEFWLGFDSTVVHTNIYSTTEKDRNNKYNYQEFEIHGTTDADGTKIIECDSTQVATIASGPIDYASGVELYTTVGGKDKFKIKARDNCGTIKYSKMIETRRLIYIQEFKMNSSATSTTPLPSITPSLNILKSEYLNHGIELKDLPVKSVPYMPNIANSNLPTLKSYVNLTPGKQPYVIGIVYTGHEAMKDSNVSHPPVGSPEVSITYPVGTGQAPIVKDVKKLNGSSTYLWKNIESSEDWFVLAQYIPDGGGSPISIPKSRVTPIPEYPVLIYPHLVDRCKKISIDVSHLPTGRGKIKILLNVVNRFRGGLSLGSANLVCICTKAYWKNSSSSAQNNVTIHEIGHKVGMVADGTGIKPDKVQTYYLAKGHVGAHCSKGLSTTQLSTTDYKPFVSSSTCVMFGTTNGFSDFCIHCAKAVKKTDITGGF